MVEYKQVFDPALDNAMAQWLKTQEMTADRYPSNDAGMLLK